MLKRKDKFLLIGVILLILIIICLITISLFLPKQVEDKTSYTPSPKSEEPPLDTCGNGVCEEYELLANCKKDCEGLETHTYGFCRSASWGGVYRVKVLGTKTYLDAGEMIGPDMNPRPTCGRDGLGTGQCFYCYNITEVHEPIFEIQINPGASANIPICENLVEKYFVDGVDLGCKDGKWEYVGRNAYYPYDKKRFGQFMRVKIH